MTFFAQEQANYKQLTEDLEAELARVKKDASEHAAQLSAAAQAKGEAASAARSEAARSRVGFCPACRCDAIDCMVLCATAAPASQGR